MDDIQFYDSQVEYQKRVGDIEKQRLQLERQMFSLMKSDKKLHNLKTAKLRSYWQQVCEKERKARERNEELMRDFEKMENELNALQSRTKRLHDLRTQQSYVMNKLLLHTQRKYDEKVKELYPKWRKDVELSRAKKQLEERGINILSAKEKVQESSSVANYSTYNHSGEQTNKKQSHKAKRKNPIHEKPNKVWQSSSDHQISPYHSKNMVKGVRSTEDVLQLIDSKDLDEQKMSVLPSPLTDKKIISPRDGASSHPPPDSFADDTKAEAVYINTTAPSKAPSHSDHPVVHTIPTAVSPNDLSDFSDPSLQMEGQQEHYHDDSESESISVDEPLGKNNIPSSESKHVPAAKKVASTTTSPSHTSISKTSPKHSLNEKNKRKSSEQLSPTSPGKILSSKSPPYNSSLSSFPSPDHHGHGLRIGLQSRNTEKGGQFSLGSSLESNEGLSERKHAPLTANAAYQAMLKQHSGMKIASPTFHDSDNGSDEDNVDNILSPHATLKNDEEDNDDNKSENEDSSDDDEFSNKSPVYIPTAMSSTGSSLQRKDQMREVMSKPPKAPWDSDSEDDDSLGDTSFLGTGSSWKTTSKKSPQQTLQQDDFDFYD